MTTIVEAAISVMRNARKPMSAREVYEAISAEHLFTFKAKDPVRVVETQLKRHCVGAVLASAPKAKHFVRSQGVKYALL